MANGIHKLLAPALAVAAVLVAPLVAQRAVSERMRLAAVREGLGLLRVAQNDDGSFGRGPVVANTSLAVMAFLATGHLPNEAPKGRIVERGIRWIVGRPVGSDFAPRGNSYVYEYSLALLMMAEVYGILDDRDLERKLVAHIEAGIRVAEAGQSPNGAWGYAMRSSGGDLSTTVMVINALRACHNAGFTVKGAVMKAAVAYVISCRSRRSEGFAYRPNSQRSAGTNAAGLVCLQITGSAKRQALRAEFDVLAQQLASGDLGPHPLYTTYYMAQALFQAGGKVWRNRYPKLVAQILRLKQNAEWGNDQQAYQTGFALIALSAPERQLPIYIQADPSTRAGSGR